MQCFVDSLEVASRVEITRPFKMNVYSKPVRNRRFLEKLYRLALKKSKGGDLDVRYFALAWMESRLRQFTRIGDRGRTRDLSDSCSLFLPSFPKRERVFEWDEST